MLPVVGFGLRSWKVSALLVALVSCAGWACKGGGSEGATPTEPQVEPAFAAAPAAVPKDQPGIDEGQRAHLNLLNLAHLADVDQGGLFLDFGTPARMKYTVGNWKTGFGKDGADGETTWTRVGATGRVYLPLPQEGPVALRLRMKPIGTQNLQLFVNGKSLPIVRMAEGQAFANYDVPLPAEVIKGGENQLLLRFGGTTKLDGDDVAVAIDYLRVLSGADAVPPPADAVPVAPEAAATAEGAVPLYGKLVQDVVIGAAKRRALVQRGPSRLSFYVDVPAQASLGFRVGQVEGRGSLAKITVEAEGSPSQQIFSQPLQPAWSEKKISLQAFSGRVVRIDLVSEGAGSIAWSSPAILVPEVKVAKTEPAKSVIVLLIDTLRADKLRAYNPQSRVQTPALDAFAKEGTVFVNSQSPENWTKPSVASVLTGLYPMTHGTKQSESRLPDGVSMLSEVLKASGFTTGSFIANGYVSDKFGFAQGWDHYTNYIRENKNTDAQKVFKEAGDWIEAHHTQRFFAYVHTIDPHVPYDPPQKFLDMYDAEPYAGIVSPRKTPDQLEKAKRNPPAVTFNERDRQRLEALYDAEISYHDEHLASFIERLKKLGVYDDLIFVVTSDHGEEFYDHKSYGHGHTVYQELLHVPLMFRRPGVVPAGKRIEEAVGTLDVTPTVLAAVGVAAPEAVEGRDRMPHMQGLLPAMPAVAFSDFLDDRRTIRAGRYKLILSGINATFFDLQTDPGEKRELDAQSHPIARRYCRMLLGQFMGARNLRDWLSAEQAAPAQRFRENTVIDEKTREGLKALGYAN